MTQQLSRMFSNFDCLQRIGKLLASDDELKEMSVIVAAGKATMRLTRGASMLVNFGAMPSIGDCIAGCDWILLLAPRESRFTLSDVPVFTCDPYSSERSRAGVGLDRNETTLPLTPQKCLLLRPGRSSGFRVRRASAETVLEINRQSAYASVERIFVSRPDEQLKALVSEFPPRLAEQSASTHEGITTISNLVNNQNFRPIWPE